MGAGQPADPLAEPRRQPVAGDRVVVAGRTSPNSGLWPGRAGRRPGRVRRRRRRRSPALQPAARGRVRRPRPRPTHRAATPAVHATSSRTGMAQRTRNWSIPIVNLLFCRGNTRSSRRMSRGLGMVCRHAGDDRRGRHSRHRARRRGGAPRPRGRAAGTRGRGPRRDRAQLRPGLGVRSARGELATRCGPESCGRSSATRSPASVSGPPGRITLLRTPREVAVAEEVVARPDAESRGFTLLDPSGVRALNPALRGKYLAGLHCSRDAAVESRQALPAIREHMAATGRYTFLPAPRRGRSTAPRSPTTTDTTTRATWWWSAQAPHTAAWSARSQAICRSAGSGCR